MCLTKSSQQHSAHESKGQWLNQESPLVAELLLDRSRDQSRQQRGGGSWVDGRSLQAGSSCENVRLSQDVWMSSAAAAAADAAAAAAVIRVVAVAGLLCVCFFRPYSPRNRTGSTNKKLQITDSVKSAA